VTNNNAFGTDYLGLEQWKRKNQAAAAAGGKARPYSTRWN
jgi:hypothetical protein